MNMSWGRRTAFLLLPAFILKAGICSVLFLVATPTKAQPPCHKDSKKEQCIDCCKVISQEAAGDTLVIPAPQTALEYTAPRFVSGCASSQIVLAPSARTRLISLQILLI